MLESLPLINAGARNGKTENHETTRTIKVQTITFSNFLGRRESGVVRLIVTISANITNFVRPAIIQEKGAMNASEPEHLAARSITIKRQGKK